MRGWNMSKVQWYMCMKMSWWISSFSRLTKTIKSKKSAIHPKTRHHIMIMGAGPLETTSMQQPLSSAVVYLFSCSVCGEVSCCLQRFRGFFPLIIVSILFIMFCVIYFIFTSFPVLKIQIVQTFFFEGGRTGSLFQNVTCWYSVSKQLHYGVLSLDRSTNKPGSCSVPTYNRPWRDCLNMATGRRH